MRTMSHKQLKWIRENQGLSREEFAKKLKISVLTYNGFESGKMSIPTQVEKNIVSVVRKTK